MAWKCGLRLLSWFFCLLPLAVVAAPAASPSSIDREWRDRVVLGYYADGQRNQKLADQKARAAVKAANASGDIRAKLRSAIQLFSSSDAWNDECRWVDEYLTLAKSGGEPYLQELFDISVRARNKTRPLCASELSGEELEALAARLGDPARKYYVLDAQARDAGREGRFNDALALQTAQLAYTIDEFQAVAAMFEMVDNELVTHPKGERATQLLKSAFDRLGDLPYPSLRAGLLYLAFNMEIKAENIDAALARFQEFQAATPYLASDSGYIAHASLVMSEALNRLHRPLEALAVIEKIPSSSLTGSEMKYGRARAVLRSYIELGTQDAHEKGLREIKQLKELLADPSFADPRRAYNSHLTIAAFHRKFGDYKAALDARDDADKAREERQKLANDKVRVEVQEKLNLAVKEQEISRLKAQTELQAATQRGWISAFAAAALGVAGAGAALVVAVRRGRRLAKVSAQLAQRNGELEERSASRIRLLAAACHDLRQPAHALGMLAEMGAEAQREPKRFATWLHGVQRSAASLGEMLDELMDLGRLDSGHYKPQLSAVSLAELMHDVMLHFGALARRKGLSLEVPPADGHVLSDRHLLRRIVFNLVSNAIKYTDTGTVCVQTHLEPDGQSLTLKVQDSGPGIPADKLDEVFRDYVRLNPSKAAEGLGIGLSIVRRASDLLGHALKLDSQPGQGTTVSLQLPLSLSRTVAPAGAPQAQRLDPAQGVLALMEDEADVREAMVELLKSWGYTVRAASDAHGLLTLLQESQLQPDLIITDMHLGGHNGLDEVAQLRQALQAPALPALLVTGDVDAAIATQAAQAQVFVANKPLAPRRLSALVSQLLSAKAEAPSVSEKGQTAHSL